MTSEFVEGWTWKFPVNDYDRDWLLAPFLMYSTGGPIYLLPHTLDQADLSYISILKRKILEHPRLVYFGRDLPPWLSVLLRDYHQKRLLSQYRCHTVLLFEQPPL